METTTQTSLDFSSVSEIQISYRPAIKPSARPKVSSSKEAFQILTRAWDSGKILLVEEFKVMFLNRGHRVLGILTVSQGGIAGTVVDIRIIFAAALKCCAIGIIVSHNHPSGNMTASEADITLTKKIQQAGKLLDIELMDHLIVTNDKYLSFADEGML